MTETEIDSTVEVEVPVETVAVRTFTGSITPGDGRTVDLRIVPYGERVRANDGLGGLPRGVEYTEEFVSGVFDHVMSAPNRILLDFEHGDRLEDVVGRGVSVADRPDGFHTSFRMLNTPAGNTALELVREEVLTGASVECRFYGPGTRSIRTAEGVVRRVKAKLNKVALCREPAYSGAVVLGVRTTPSEVILDEEMLPIPFDPELALRIAALGITIPDRLLAPPATDPSASADTSESTPANGLNND